MKPAFEDTLPIEESKPAFEDTEPIEPTSQMASNISAIARPILEGGGAIAGSLLGGGPETPIGLAGMALGYGGGKAASDLLDRKLGLKAPLQNLPEAIQETGGDIKTGAELGTANLLINPALRGIGRAALKGASAYFGPSEQAINARLANPALAESSFPKTADDLSSNLNTLQDNLNKIEKNVWGSLLKLKAEPKSALLGMLNNVKGQLKITNTGEVGSDADQSALDALDRLSERIKNMGTTSGKGANLILGPGKGTQEFFDQQQLREILQSARKDINWSDPTSTPKNEAILNFTHYLSEYLKKENPQYADLIQQSADRTALLANAEKAFALKKINGQFEPGDGTAAKLQALLKPGKFQTQQVAGKVKELTGMDLQQAAQNAQYAGEFEKTATQGSRRVGIGATIGAAIGSQVGSPWEGAAIGAQAGGYLDKYAAQNLGSAIDLINRLGITSSINPIGSLGLLAAMAGKEQGQ